MSNNPWFMVWTGAMGDLSLCMLYKNSAIQCNGLSAFFLSFPLLWSALLRTEASSHPSSFFILLCNFLNNKLFFPIFSPILSFHCLLFTTWFILFYIFYYVRKFFNNSMIGCSVISHTYQQQEGKMWGRDWLVPYILHRKCIFLMCEVGVCKHAKCFQKLW